MSIFTDNLDHSVHGDKTVGGWLSVRRPHWDAWQQHGYTRLPLVLSSTTAALPDAWAGFTDSPVSVLLEGGPTGRYIYFCDRAKRMVIGSEDHGEIWNGDFAVCLLRVSGPPADVFSSLNRGTRVPQLVGAPPMPGGWIGVFGYDTVRTWERLPPTQPRDLALPLYLFIEPQDLYVYDALKRQLIIIVWTDISLESKDLAADYDSAQQRSHAALRRWQQSCEAPGSPRNNEGAIGAVIPPPSFTRDGFITAVRRAQDYIAAGHTYQVNLSLRSSRAAPVSPETIYDHLRRLNPSPYMGLLRTPMFSLVCGSPELLVRMLDGAIVSRPIAGTRRRGLGVAEDHRLTDELLANEKERAEHLMLVDLIRNDIGRVAEFGSVRVREFMEVERYSHVMHIVSEVEGRLAQGQKWVDVLQAMFPGGTVTGCPKLRTIELIEELESMGRGFYTGSLGWVSYQGDLELNIIIRSMLVLNGVAHVQAGAGIVADSDPEHEFDEATRKAAVLWLALEECLKSQQVANHA